MTHVKLTFGKNMTNILITHPTTQTRATKSLPSNTPLDKILPSLPELQQQSPIKSPPTSPASTVKSEVDYFGGRDPEDSDDKPLFPHLRSSNARAMVAHSRKHRINTDHQFNNRGTCTKCGAWRRSIAKCPKHDMMPESERNASAAEKLQPQVATNHSFKLGVCKGCGAIRRELKMCATMSTTYRQAEEVDYSLASKDFGRKLKTERRRKAKRNPTP
jgi:hypothetical protein